MKALQLLILVGAAQEICYLPLDVMFLQDTTGSFDDDLPNVVKQIPDMVNAILAEHPESWFGVAEFKDKPYYPLGESVDFCYKLGDGKLSPDMNDFNWAYSGLYASGGGDLPEAQLQALINIAYDGVVGWRPLANGGTRAQAGQAGARLVILSTDAVPHLPGDIDKFDPVQYPDLPRNLPLNSGSISTGDVNYECLYQDYPSAQQMQAALAAQNIYLAILTPNDAAIVSAWQWVNQDLLGQPAEFYQFISADSSDLLKGVLNAIEAVTSYLCPTTTVAPTTVAPTTVAPTTVAPTTVAPTTVAPTTVAPTTIPPTMAPTTPTLKPSLAPTTATAPPTTAPPTTLSLTTMASTTPIPTPSVLPTTLALTTTSTTTATPTTLTPTTAPTPTPSSTTTVVVPTTPLPATTQPISLAPSTPDATVSPAGSTQQPPSLTSEATEVPATCPPCEHPCPNPCHCCPAVIIKVADKPSYLRIDYQK